MKGEYALSREITFLPAYESVVPPGPGAAHRSHNNDTQQGRTRVRLRHLAALCLGHQPAENTSLNLDKLVYPLSLPGTDTPIVIISSSRLADRRVGYVFFQDAENPSALHLLECAGIKDAHNYLSVKSALAFTETPFEQAWLLLLHFPALLFYTCTGDMVDRGKGYAVLRLLIAGAQEFASKPLSLTDEEELRQLLEDSFAACAVTFSSAREVRALVKGKEKYFRRFTARVKAQSAYSAARVAFKLSEGIDGVIIRVLFDNGRYEYLMAWHPDDPNHPTYNPRLKRGWFDETERLVKARQKVLRAYYEECGSQLQLRNRPTHESVLQFQVLSGNKD